jgi:predicted methyltransferase
MSMHEFLQLMTSLVVLCGYWQFASGANHETAAQRTIEQIMTGEHRSDANIARNPWRHPVETLPFFGLEPDMTLIESGPCGAWYTEILAPYMRDPGRYYGAHLPANPPSAFQRRSLENFEAKLAANPELYGKATVRALLPPNETAIAPEEGADIAMTFRNVHNWMAADLEHEYFEAFFAALKPGGVLGVVEHRALPTDSREDMIRSGYVGEAYVKEIAQAAGFEFVASAEINANPKDPTGHPEGVWTLPPEYRMGEADRARYSAIGESDRMTLKFRKPAN